MSTYEERGQFQGLYTAIAETLAPQGALRVADNVVIRRLGAVEPRQGFTPDGPTWNDNGFRWLWSIPATCHDLGNIQLYSRDLELWHGKTSASSINRVAFGFSPAFTYRMRSDIWSHSKARGNSYLATSEGVVRLAEDGATWRTAGAVAQFIAAQDSSGGSAGTVLPNNTHVGYRVVGVRKDGNGLETRTTPTGSVDIPNTTGAGKNPTLYVFASTQGGFSSLEIYRTRVFPIGIALDEEYALVRVVDELDFPTSFFSYTDTVLDNERGASLYTSPSQLGFEGANSNPPACALIESYKGCMFFANIAGPQRLLFSYKFSTTFLDGQATGVGVRRYTATATAGSNQLTALSGTAGLQIGQMISDAASVAWSGFRRITAISGTTITMNSTATNGVTQTFYFSDSIEVTAPSPLVNVQYYFLPLFPTVPSFGGSRPPVDMQAGVSSYGYGGRYVTPPLPGYTNTLVIEDSVPNRLPIKVRATHGDEYNPPLPTIASGTPKESEKDVYPNGVLHSLPDQPEHVPLSSFLQINEKSQHILGMVATRDSLFFFKEDGIWRLSGLYGDFRVDPFDMTTFCVLPTSIQRLDGRIYMLSNKGVVVIDETGVEIISEPIHDQVARLVDNCRSNLQSLGYYKLTGVDGFAATVDSRTSEYILLVGSTDTDIGGDALVFNARTGAWTTWSFGAGGLQGFTPLGMAVDDLGYPLICHSGDVRKSNVTLGTLDGESMVSSFDGTNAVTATSGALVPGTSQADITLSGTVSTSPDDIYQTSDGKQYPIVTQQAANIITIELITADVLPVNGAATIYRAITCVLQLHGFAQPKPVGKLWQRALWAFGRFVGPVKTRAVFSSAGPALPPDDQELTELPAVTRPNGYAAHHEGALLQSLVPQPHQRSWLVRATLRLVLAFGRVSLETVGMESRENAPNRTLQSSTGTT